MHLVLAFLLLFLHILVETLPLESLHRLALFFVEVGVVVLRLHLFPASLAVHSA